MKAAIAAALIAVATGQSRAEKATWFEQANLRNGKRTCTQWIEDRSNLASRKNDTAWVLGYLSALATSRTSAINGELNDDRVPAEIDAICAANPESDLRQATRLLAVKLGLEPMPK